MVERKEYIDVLRQWKDEQVIKVVTGLHRCGKSTLLQMFRDELLKSGVPEDQTIFINFEDFAFEELLDYRKLYRYVCDKLITDKMNYVFLDEVQLVPEYQKAVDSLQLQKNIDIYITGSNAYLLSGELATLLSGRYVEINMLPLSFSEYCRIKGNGDREKQFADYMRYGSLPYIATLKNTTEQADIYLEGIYNTIIVKDIELRQQRREKDPNKRRVNNITLLKNISKFLANSIGSPISIKSITNYISSNVKSVSQNTVGDYVESLVEPYLFYPIERYDVLGKKLLKQNCKYYISDLGIRRHLLPRSRYDLGFSLENLICLELMRRGYTVNIGKVGTAEVDFVVRKGEDTEYYQVTASMTDEATFNREISPLRSISDNYPKTVLTLDRLTLGNYDGILVKNAIDWLLE